MGGGKLLEKRNDAEEEKDCLRKTKVKRINPRKINILGKSKRIGKRNKTLLKEKIAGKRRKRNIKGEEIPRRNINVKWKHV